MAVRRINLMEAVTATANTVARSRTAVVRRGKVTAVPDSAGTTKVLLGGATVDAVALKTGALNVNDQVAILADTDAYWIAGVIGASTAQTFADADFGPASTNYSRTISGTKVPLAGGGFLSQIAFTLTNTNAITVPASGQLGVTATTVPAGLIPAAERLFCGVELLAAATGGNFWQLRTDGVLRWVGATAGLSIPAGQTRTVHLLYMM